MSQPQQSATTINKTTEDGTKVAITPIEGNISLADVPKTIQEVSDKLTSVELPSNAAIDSSIKDAKDTISEGKRDLDAKGKRLADDASKILDSTSTIIKEKNKGDKLQKLMRDTRDFVPSAPSASQVKSTAQDLAKNVPANKLKGDAKAIAQDTQELYNYISKFALNFVQSEDFRGLATEWMTFFQAMAVDKIEDAADKGADYVKKTGDDIKKSGKAKDLGEKAKKYVDDAAEKVKDGADTVEKKVKENVPSKKELKDKVEEGAEKVKDTADRAKKEGPKKVDEAADKAEYTFKEKADDVKEGADKAAKKAKDSIPSKEEAKKKVDDVKESVKDGADKAEKKVKEGAEKVKDKAEQGKEKTKDAADKAEKKAKDASKDTKEKAKDAKDNVKEGAEKAEKKTKEGAEKVKDKAKEGKDKAKDATDKVAEKVKDNIPSEKDAKKKVDDAKETVKDGADKAKSKAKEVKEDAKDTAKDAIEKGADKTKEVADKAEKVAKDNLPETQKIKDAASKGADKVKDLADQAKDATGKNAKDAGRKAEKAVKDGVDAAQDLAESAKGAIKENLPETAEPKSEEELMERTQELFNKFVNKVVSKKEYQDTVKDFFKLYDRMKTSLWDLKEEIKSQAEGKAEEKKSQLETVVDDAYDLVSEWTGEKELEQFRSQVFNLYKSIRDDEKLSSWFSNLKEYMLDVMSRPETIQSERKQKEAKKLLQKGRRLLSADRYSKEFQKVNKSGQAILENLKNDSTTLELKNNIGQFLQDFAFNSRGVPDFGVISDSVAELKAFLVPTMRRKLAVVPFKRIEIVSDDYDVKLEDMKIVAGGLFPERLDLFLRSSNHLDFNDSRKDKVFYQIELSVDRIKPDFKDVKFYYLRKTFPSIEDHGVADIKFGGEGISLKANWTIDVQANQPARAVLSELKCDIDSLDIDIVGEKTKHNILDTLLLPLVSGIIKNRIADAIEDGIKSQIDDFNRIINAFFATRPTEQLLDQANAAMQTAYQKIEEGGADALSQLQSQGTQVLDALQGGVQKVAEKVNETLPSSSALPSAQK